MNTIEKYADRIEDGLQSIPFKKEPASLYDPCRYVLKNGGKRIRPILTLLGAGICGGNIEHSIPAALSVELVHNFTLVHDDIMDQADSRRGKPSIHKKWNEATAILAGDELFVQACSLLSGYLSDPSVSEPRFKKLYDTFLNSIHT
ncbi:MAG: polyprenyl synthetase family protein, partial [Balneolaceae bacterium]